MTLAEKFTAFKTIVIKEVLRFARIWVQTIVPPVITISLYFVIFGNLIGSQIGDMDGFRGEQIFKRCLDEKPDAVDPRELIENGDGPIAGVHGGRTEPPHQPTLADSGLGQVLRRRTPVVRHQLVKGIERSRS